MKRGQIWWADLGEPRGANPAFRRPVIVVQEDLLSASRLETVMVVPLTSNLRRAVAMGNLLLKGKETGLTQESVALVCQVTTLDKTLLTQLVGALSRTALNKLDAGLTLALGLERSLGT